MIDHKKYSYLDMPFDQNTAFLNPAHPEHTHETKLSVFVRIARLLLGMEDLMAKADAEGRTDEVMQTLLNHYKISTGFGKNVETYRNDAGELLVPKDTLIWQELGKSGRNMLLELRYNDNVVFLNIFIGGGLAWEVTIQGWHFNSEAQQVIHDHAKAMDDAGGFWGELHGTVPLKFNI